MLIIEVLRNDMTLTIARARKPSPTGTEGSEGSQQLSPASPSV